jgi:hypothetical protein
MEGALAKTCTSCLKEKELCAFYRKGKRLDSQCKSCILYAKKRRKALADRAAKKAVKLLANYTILEVGKPDLKLLAKSIMTTLRT